MSAGSDAFVSLWGWQENGCRKKTSNIFLKIPHNMKKNVKRFANMIKPLKVRYRQDTKRNNLGNYPFPRNNGHFDLFATKRGKGYFLCLCQFI